MRLAVIADVHGNLPALEAVLEDMATRSVDLVVNCGDCVTAPLWPRETLAALRELNAPTVRGNHDRWLGEPGPDDRSRIIAFARAEIGEHAARELHALPATLEVVPGVLAVHGNPSSDTAYLLEESVDHRLRLVSPAVLEERLGSTDCSLVLCGHSHIQHAASTRDGRLVLNPGSVGTPRYAGNTDAEFNEAGSLHARYAIATRRGNQWSVECMALPYDWDAATARARNVGFDHWADNFARCR